MKGLHTPRVHLAILAGSVLLTGILSGCSEISIGEDEGKGHHESHAEIQERQERFERNRQRQLAEVNKWKIIDEALCELEREAGQFHADFEMLIQGELVNQSAYPEDMRVVSVNLSESKPNGDIPISMRFQYKNRMSVMRYAVAHGHLQHESCRARLDFIRW